MKEEEYYKKTKDLRRHFIKPSLSLKARVLKSSQETTPKNKPNRFVPVGLIMALAFTVIVFSTLKQNQTSEVADYLTHENYVANFNLKDLNLDEASYIELELPENIDIVSKNKNILKKKSFIFMWSVFSESKIVSFPFKAVKEGKFNLEIKILDKNMEMIETKSITLDVREG